MAATDEAERAGGQLHARQRGDSIAVPEDVDSGNVTAMRGSAEALKRAACDAACEHLAHIEQGNVYGCVDWYLYPDSEPRHAGR